MKTDPSFDQIPIRMLQLGVDRQWLAEQCDYTRGTLAAILAPKGAPRHKTDKALRRIWEALDREEERQNLPAMVSAVSGIFEIPQTAEETALTDRASRIVRADSLADFCKEAILHRARQS